ncbi:MAG: translation initiation factor IF-2 [Desulfohalobiaceae bacterium]|nr:translation initiation factor IF-2 [Desulfohalobiaceae bacterium]
MTTKMRVRELSAELGLSNKDMLHMLRENNIQVKSHMSGLSEDEVEHIRQQLRSGSRERYSQRKVTSSGVIVRRRRRGRQSEQEPAEESREKAESPEPEASAEATEKPQTAEGTESAPSQQESAAEKEELSASPETGEKTAEQAPSKGKRRKKSRKKAQEQIQPEVTVISRPEAEEGEPPPAEVSSDSGVTQGEAVAPPPEAEQKQDKPSKKKKKKEKRTVDVSGLYEGEESQEVPGEKQEQPKKEKSGAKQPRKRKGAKGGPAKAGKPSREAKPAAQPQKAAKRKIRIQEAIKVSELAQEMGVKAQEIIKALMSLGTMATINQPLDVDTASVIAAEYGYEVEETGFSEEAHLGPEREDSPEELEPRPPVVTIMGHVDHGKTSLLDGIRESHIMAKESGGITQHIGAYHVTIRGNTIVFLDTPGHEAFTEMRSRGAQVTDIVVLIVAADDGVMEQTKEAINHARAAEVPILVAVNKVDKDNADPERVKRELAEQDLLPEEWGGETIFTYISAKQREGIDQVLEMILLQSEILELKANPNKRARGHIVEAKLDKGKGPVGTVLVQEGTLYAGDAAVCGLYHGRVRALFNDRGQRIHSAGPSTPVEVQGLEGVPNAGDEFVVLQDEKVAKRIAEARQQKQRERDLAQESKVTLESFFQAKKEEELKTLNLILKADVHGSLEAVSEAVQKLTTEEVQVNILHGGIGSITESDIKLASASRAVLIGFNVRPTARIMDMAESEGVDIRYYNIIYQLVGEVKEAMAGLLTPITREIYLGQAEVRETFQVPKAGTIAGCYVVDGKLQRNASVRLLRDGVVIHSGKLDSLKRFKEDAKEVTKGYECGAGLAGYNDIKIGDVLEAYTEVQERPSLD